MRINRSKYGFSKLKVGETFPISPMDIYSMKNSLRFYNKQHKQDIEIEVEDDLDGGMQAKRTK